MTDKPSLAPCPFCGCDYILPTLEQDGRRGYGCNDCQAVVPGVGTDREATEAWNTRAPSVQVDVVEQFDTRELDEKFLELTKLQNYPTQGADVYESIALKTQHERRLADAFSTALALCSNYAVMMSQARAALHQPPSKLGEEEAHRMKLDGVHTFKEMEALALDWKHKFNARVDESQNLHMQFCEFRDAVAKALGIQVGRPNWWDINSTRQEQRIFERIKKLRDAAYRALMNSKTGV